MHNAAFAALGLNWAYAPLPVAPAHVAEAALGLRALGMRGANVTVPHKQAIMPQLDALSDAARAIGAVNTIVVEEDGRLQGDNTDAAGFAADLAAHGVAVAGRRVALLGAGGSARAVLYALIQGGAAQVMILNRNPIRAAALVEEFGVLTHNSTLAALPFPDSVQTAKAADLIINCTSLGMSPNAAGLPWDASIGFRPGQVVYDLVYNPGQTRLLQMAVAQGAQAIGGLGMLVWQGALAFRLWTGLDAPVELMRAAAERRLVH
jgi:shikimate dehydrogenase